MGLLGLFGDGSWKGEFGLGLDSSFLGMGGQQAEARVGIGLEEADFECKNSLILLVIQHFCGTIFTDSFTMVC